MSSSSSSISHRADHAAAGPSTERRGVALMTAGGLLLGTIGVFVLEAGQDPLTTVWFRCAFGGAALLLWAMATRRLGELWLHGRLLAWAIAAGVLMVANWAMFFAAIERTSIGVATVVFHVQPLWVMALGAWWLHEPLPRSRVVAALVALGGLALATGLLDEGGAETASKPGYLIGLLLCLGGSLSYAGVTLIARVMPPDRSLALAWWQCMVGVLSLAAWPLANGWPPVGPTWAWLAGLGVVHTGLAYVVLYAGMSRLPTDRIALLQFVYPASAIVIDWLVYGRALTALQMLGVAAMGLALWSVRRAG